MTRFTDNDAPPHRSRKDRKRWCRGKPGVEHQPVMRLSKGGLRQQVLGQLLCGWRHHWRRDAEGRAVPDLKWYMCWHEIACEACGKVLEYAVDERCPDRRERVTS